jgi:hypothetical protein
MYDGIVLQGYVTDIREENVVQPLLVTTSAIKLAAECVRSILKIDDIVSQKQTFAPETSDVYGLGRAGSAQPNKKKSFCALQFNTLAQSHIMKSKYRSSI